MEQIDLTLCKDCVFCSEYENGTYHCRSMRGLYRAVEENEYCSWGEKKDGEE